MNIEVINEFCLYCKKKLQQDERYYHISCHEESKIYKNQFENFKEIDGKFYWKKDWESEKELREWAENFRDVKIFIDYKSIEDEKTGLNIFFVHDLRIINRANVNIPNILFFKRIENIYLFFQSKLKEKSFTYSIPKSIWKLKTLKGLWIDHIQEREVINKTNNIKPITGSLEELVNLERLFLLYEGANFPKGLKNLKNLKEITIGNNYTSNKINFSTELFMLPNLKILSCGFIDPTERLNIVKGLKKMKSIEYINFRDNDYNLPKRISNVDFKLKITNFKDANKMIKVF